MWIEELRIRGFGRLSGHWRFAPGLTLVIGRNEAGKSTLHDAIVRALFGFSRNERRRNDGVSRKDARRPWTGGEFALTAVVRDARGRAWRVDWDFERYEAEVRDHETGADLTPEVRRSSDAPALGEVFLDLPYEQFLAVCCLRQETIGPVPGDEPLIAALRRAAETHSRDHGVDEAIALLEAHLRDQVGVHVQQLQPLAGRPFAQARDQLEEVRARLDACRARARELQQLGAERARLSAELAEVRGAEAALAR
ncbi:MAG TPA: AAA family ATPase, partial [Vicinamibacterales bacterium]|nr:AAA family ATPase [Vicinamibacterales bacterium]